MGLGDSLRSAWLSSSSTSSYSVILGIVYNYRWFSLLFNQCRKKKKTHFIASVWHELSVLCVSIAALCNQ